MRNPTNKGFTPTRLRFDITFAKNLMVMHNVGIFLHGEILICSKIVIKR